MEENFLVIVKILTRGYDTYGLVLSECVVVGPFTEEGAKKYAGLLSKVPTQPGHAIRVFTQRLPFKPELKYWGQYGVDIDD